MNRLALTLILISIAVPAFARPVSYPGGWTVMTENDGDENSALVHYTLTPHTALGYRLSYDRDTHEVFNGLQMNNLIKRWNNPDSQANIYVQSAIGFAEHPEGFTGINTDWESRRYMVMYGNRVTVSPEDEKSNFHQSLGLGIAPYLGESGDLQTWIMPHVLYKSEDDKQWQFAPMLRFFKNEYLLEAGYNVTTNSPIADAIIRF